MWTALQPHRLLSVPECSRSGVAAGPKRLAVPCSRTPEPHVALHPTCGPAAHRHAATVVPNAAATTTMPYMDEFPYQNELMQGSPEAHPSRPGASSWRSRMAEAPAAPTGPPGTYTRQPGPNAAAGGPAGLLQRGTAESNKTAVGPGAAGLSAAAGPAKPWSVIGSTPLAGGLLQVVVWEGRRNIRVWLPPGYSKEEGQRYPWPVLYCNDGQNVFGDCTTLSGDSWRVAHTAAELIQSGRLPPFMVVGLDHAGPLRSLEYTPYTPGSGPGGFRSDAAQWPGGGVSAYLARVQQEVLPWVAREYGASLAPRDLAFAGSSFGGVAALAAGMSAAGQQEGGAFGALLVESPSMWIADEAFLKDVSTHCGPWPERVYLGMGGKEYSGLRGGRGQEHDAHFPRYLKSLYAALTEQGLGPDRLAWAYEPGASHSEGAWASRLPQALAFVGQGWWAGWASRQGAAGRRLATCPGQITAGKDGQVLFFNRAASSSLSKLPAGTKVKVSMGVDGWKQVQQLELQPLGTGLHYHIAPPAQLQQEVFEAWGLDPQLQEHLHKRLLEKTVKGQQGVAGGSRGGNSSNEDWWVLQLPAPPLGCSKLDMAFCDGAEKVWDNNEQQDYHLQVAPTQQQAHGTAQPAAGRGAATASRGGGTIAAVALTPTAGVNGARPSSSSSNGGNIPSAAVAAAATTPVQTFSSRAATAEGVAGGVLRMLESLRTCAIGDGCGFVSRDSLDRAEQNILHGANAPAHQAAATAEANGQMVFLMPQQPVAGLPVSLYVNKARLQDVLKRSPNMCLQVGFNNWSVGLQKVPFRPAMLSRNDSNDWWCCRLEVPPEANQCAFAICGMFNGCENWDNNQGKDYKLNVLSLEAAVVRAVAEACIGLDVGLKPQPRAPATDKHTQAAAAAPRLAYA